MFGGDDVTHLPLPPPCHAFQHAQQAIAKTGVAVKDRDVSMEVLNRALELRSDSNASLLMFRKVVKSALGVFSHAGATGLCRGGSGQGLPYRAFDIRGVVGCMKSDDAADVGLPDLRFSRVEVPPQLLEARELSNSERHHTL